MDASIRAFIDKIAAETPALTEIWLIGSRANGTETAESDWDFIAFGTPAALASLRASMSLHRQDADFLVVTDGDAFQNAWGDKEKTGSLSGWAWKVTAGGQAEYTQTKWEEGEDGGDVVSSRRAGIKVWPTGQE